MRLRVPADGEFCANAWTKRNRRFPQSVLALLLGRVGAANAGTFASANGRLTRLAGVSVSSTVQTHDRTFSGCTSTALLATSCC